MTPKKQSYRHNRIDARMNSQRLWQHAQVQTRQTLKTKKGKPTRIVSPLTKELFACWYLMWKGKSFFSNRTQQGVPTILQGCLFGLSFFCWAGHVDKGKKRLDVAQTACRGKILEELRRENMTKMHYIKN